MIFYPSRNLSFHYLIHKEFCPLPLRKEVLRTHSSVCGGDNIQTGRCKRMYMTRDIGCVWSMTGFPPLSFARNLFQCLFTGVFLLPNTCVAILVILVYSKVILCIRSAFKPITHVFKQLHASHLHVYSISNARAHHRQDSSNMTGGATSCCSQTYTRKAPKYTVWKWSTVI